ncbi:MAG: hypothetical protein ACOYU3_02295 [Bacillota bacterium]
MIPLRILWELLDALEDISLFVRVHSKADIPGIIRATAETVHTLSKMGRFDMVDVDVGHAGDAVKIKVCLR